MTKTIGILNLTPDSCSDGGKFIKYDNALSHAELMIKHEIYAIDIGAEATNPNAQALSSEEEIKRLKPIIKDIIKLAHKNKIKISIDTYHYQTAKWAIELGVDYINDVSGARDSNIIKLIAANPHVKYFFMHNLGIPVDKTINILDSENPISILNKFFTTKIAELIDQGVNFKNLIIDPGIGFDNTPDQTFEILKNISFFKQYGLPILIGHSRKSFLTKINNVPYTERDIETLAVSSYLASKEIDYLRIHDFEIHQRYLKTLQSLK